MAEYTSLAISSEGPFYPTQVHHRHQTSLLLSSWPQLVGRPQPHPPPPESSQLPSWHTDVPGWHSPNATNQRSREHVFKQSHSLYDITTSLPYHWPPPQTSSLPSISNAIASPQSTNGDIRESPVSSAMDSSSQAYETRDVSPADPSPRSTPSPPVKEEPQDPDGCFIVELAAPASLVEVEPQALPTDIPLRATQAPEDMKKMMGVFRLNPFSMHDGSGKGVSSAAWYASQVGPLEEEPRILEFQLGLDGKCVGLDVNGEGLLTRFSPDFELHENGNGNVGEDDDRLCDPIHRERKNTHMASADLWTTSPPIKSPSPMVSLAADISGHLPRPSRHPTRVAATRQPPSPPYLPYSPSGSSAHGQGADIQMRVAHRSRTDSSPLCAPPFASLSRSLDLNDRESGVGLPPPIMPRRWSMPASHVQPAFLM